MRGKQIPVVLLAGFLFATVFTPVGRQRAATNRLTNRREMAVSSRAFEILFRINDSYDGRVIPFGGLELLSDLSRAAMRLPARQGAGREKPARADSVTPTDVMSVNDVMPPSSAAAQLAFVANTAPAPPDAATVIDTDGLAGVTRVSIVPDGGNTVVDVQTTKPVEFTPFRLQNPARLVVDLQRTAASRAREMYPSRPGVLKDVRVSQFSVHPVVTRVVADLSTDEPSLVNSVPEGVRIQIGMAEGAARGDRSDIHPVAVSRASMPLAAARNVAVAATPVETVSAVKATQAQQVVPAASVVDLTQPVKVDWSAGHQATPSARSANAARIVRTELAENTPLPQAAEAVRAAQVVAGSSQAQAPQGLESTIFSTPSYQQAAPIYTGKLISLDLVNADIRTFFRLIHKISGLNIVVDSDVNGSVTLVLDDVPWDQALDLVLKDNDLGKVFEGNVLRIAKVATLTAEAQSQATLREARVSSEPLITIFRRLKYAHVCDQSSSMGGGSGGGGGGGPSGGNMMGNCGGGSGGGSSGGGAAGGVPGVATILKKFQKGTVLSDRGNIVEDPRDNAIIITDVPSQIPVIESVINKLDTKSKQISIQVRVILASANFTRSLSTVLAGSAHNRSGSTNGAAGTGQGIIGVANTASPLPPLGAITQPSSVGATGFGAFAITNAGARYAINAAISAAEEHDQARTISRPTIVTQDNVLGEVQQGVQIPIQTDINNTIAVQYVNATLMLSVTPQVTVDHKVFLNIYVNNASIGTISTFVGPTINTQQATTQVLVPDGGTVVFGGITVTTRSRAATYVPLLGSIPVIGNLFKSSNVNDQNQELLFFVTPQVLPG